MKAFFFCVSLLCCVQMAIGQTTTPPQAAAMQGLTAEATAKVVLYDALGREVMHKQVGPAESINIELLATGLYAWRVITSEGARQSGVLQVANH